VITQIWFANTPCHLARDVFEDNMVKAKARSLRGQGQGQRFSRPRPGTFEAKGKARDLRGQGQKIKT